MSDHAERIEEQEKAMSIHTAAAAKLSASVDRLALRIQPQRTTPQQLRDSWDNAPKRTKAGFIAAIVALFTAPEVLKELGSVLVKILADVAAR